MREFEVVVTSKPGQSSLYLMDAEDLDAALARLDQLRSAGFFLPGVVFDVKEVK